MFESRKKRNNIIYYHQPLPLYRFRCDLLIYSPKEILFYKFLYPMYVNLFLNNKTYVVVQTKTVKERFSKRFNFPLDRIKVYFPDVEKIDLNSISSFEYKVGDFNFFYPAMAAVYKEHITIAYALKRLYVINNALAQHIRVHFTIKENENIKLLRYIQDNNMMDNFIFHGNIPHNQVLSMMKSANGLLFPSVIETLGLPLLEAASLGIPIIANDMGYAREVIRNYDGAAFVKVHDYTEWANSIINICKKPCFYTPYVSFNNDSWKELICFINNNGKTSEKRIICVLATASAVRGALIIYKQFINALKSYGGEDVWHVFVDKGMPMPTIPHTYYHECHTKGWGRIWFDLAGFSIIIKKLGIIPDIVFSLQNTGVR